MQKKYQNTFMKLLFMLFSALIIICLSENHVNQREKNAKIQNVETTITIGYCTKDYEAYLLQAIENYQKIHENITIELKEYPSLEYMSEIENNLKNDKSADLYLIESKYLQNLVRIGIAEQSEFDNQNMEEQFAKKAIQCTRYQEHSYGYPLGFDTCVLMYQKDKVAEVATTFSDMIQQVEENGLVAEEFLQWDKEKLLHNYGFIGQYANVGGTDGDTEKEISLNNEELIAAGSMYQQLCQCFMQELDDTTILEYFSQALLSYAIVDTTGFSYVREQGLDAGFAVLPDLSESLQTAGASVTDLLVVNVFSEKKDAARAFAKYLCLEQAETMYDSCHVFSAALVGKTEENAVFYQQYEKSVTMPKLMSLVDYWNKSNELLKRLRLGEDSATVFTEFHESIMQCLNVTIQPS